MNAMKRWIQKFMASKAPGRRAMVRALLADCAKFGEWARAQEAEPLARAFVLDAFLPMLEERCSPADAWAMLVALRAQAQLDELIASPTCPAWARALVDEVDARVWARASRALKRREKRPCCPGCAKKGKKRRK